MSSLSATVAYAAVAQAVATVVLVGVTVWYAKRTSDLAKQAKGQAEASQQAVEVAALPVLRVTKCRGRINDGGYPMVEVTLENIGNGPALDVAVQLVTWNVRTGEAARRGPVLRVDPIAAGEQSPQRARPGEARPHHHDLILREVDETERDMWKSAFEDGTPGSGIHVDHTDVFGKQLRVTYRMPEGEWVLDRDPSSTDEQRSGGR